MGVEKPLKSKSKAEIPQSLRFFAMTNLYSLGFYVLKSRCSDAEQKAWSRVPAARMS
jgi:hypothetical protein